MSGRRLALGALAVALALGSASPTRAASPTPLVHDPFAPAVSGTEPDGAGFAPELRAVLVGRTPRVSLGGRILTIGEETHGYRLVEVHRRSAVFLYGGRRVVLSLDPTPTGETVR